MGKAQAFATEAAGSLSLSPASSDDWMYRQIIQNSPFGMMLVDAQLPDLPIIYANAAFERLTGYSAAEVLGKNCRFMQGTDRQQPGRTALRDAIRQGQPGSAILRNYRKDGSMFWNEVRITPVHDAGGELRYYVGIQHDITDRKMMEESLVRSENRYRQLFDHNSAAMLLLDPHTGVIADANAAAVRFYGYALEELQAMRLGDLSQLPEADIQQRLPQAASGERTYFECRHCLASGDIRDMDGYISPVDVPDGRLLCAILIDVSGKRQAERRYRSLFEQSNDAVFIIDPAGVHLQANQRAADLFGYTRDELVGMPARDLIVPEQQAASIHFMTRLLAGDRIAPYERTFRHRDGSLLTAEVSVEVVRNEAGQPLHVQSVVRDITARKQLEQDLHDKYAELDRFFTIALDLLCIADTDGNFLKVNQAWADLLGYTEADLEQRQFLDFVHPDDIHATLAAMAQLDRQEPVLHFVNRYRAKDGSYRYIEWRSNPRGKLIYAAARDMTDRMQMEADLRESERKFRAFIEQATDAFVLTDESGHIIEWNPGMVQLTGIPAAEALGTWVWDTQYQISVMEHKTPETYAWLKGTIQAALQTGDSPWLEHIHETTIERTDGSIRVIQEKTHLIRTPHGYRIGSVLRDTTERRLMEDALRRSEERMRSLLASLTAFVIRTDLQGRYTYINSAFAAWYGCPVDHLLHRSVLSTIAMVDHHKVLTTVEACFAEPGKPVQVMLTKRLPDESLRHTLWEFIGLQNQAGEFTEIQCMGFDITHQHDLEVALDQSNARYRAAIEASMDAYYLLESVRDATGVIVDFTIVQVNDNAVREMGVPREILIGGRIGELFPINLTDGYLERYSQVVETGIPLDEEYHIPGTYVASGWFHHQVVRVDDGVAIMNRNITARKQAEAALRENEAQYRLIAENTSDGILILDGATGQIVYASPSYDLQYGRPVGGSLGMNPADIHELIHPDDRDAVFAQIYDAIARKAATLTYSYRSRHNAGHYFWREDHTTFKYAPDGTYLNAYIISRDITERKQVQQQELELSLEKERTRLLTQFIQNAAHEFRTPLSVIGSSSYLLARLAEPERRQQKVEQIELQIRQLTRLVDMLLLMAKLESHESMIQTPLDLVPLLQDVAQRMRTIHGDASPISVQVEPPLPLVMGDWTYLGQAVSQLLDNACRFSPAGAGVTVHASVIEQQIWLEVVDTGPGIEAEDLPRIFETFWRRDDAHTTPGFGLGLPIARRIIELHGGTIQIESKTGQGTRVRVGLPAAHC